MDESNKILYKLYLAMNEGVCLNQLIYDASGLAVNYRLQDINPAGEKITGLKKEDIAGKLITEIFSTSPPPFLKTFAQVSSTGEPAFFETFVNYFQKYVNISVFSPEKGWFATVLTDVTEKVIAEEKNLQLADIVQSSSDAIISGDLNGLVTSWNKGAEDMYGYSESEMMGTSVEQIFPPRIKDAILRVLGTIREGEKLHHYETVRLTRDGREIPVSLSLSPIRNKTGKIIGTSAIARNITALKEAEQQLKKSEIKYRTLIENIPDIIVRLDRDLKHLYVNPAAAKDADRPASQIVGKSIFEIGKDTENTAILAEKLKTVFAMGKPFYGEHLFTRQGEKRYYFNAATPEFTEEGQIISVLLISKNVTQLKKAEFELQQSEKRWQFALEGAGDGVWDWNAQTNQVFFSHQWKAMLGYTDEEIGNSIEEWTSRIHPDDINKAQQELKSYFQGESPVYSNEQRIRCKDGTHKWILNRGKVIEWLPDSKPARMIGTHADITQRKLAEDQLKASEAHLRTMFENSPIGILLANSEGRSQIANQTALDQLGIPDIREFQTTSFFDDPDIPADIKKRIIAGENVRFEQNMDFDEIKRQSRFSTTKTGKCAFERTITPFKKGDGSGVLEYLLQSQDITRRKYSDGLLKASEERFRTMFENSFSGIELWNANGKPVIFNQPAMDILGLTKIRDIYELSLWSDFLTPAEIKEKLQSGEMAKWEQVIDFDTIRAHKYFMTCKSGIRTVERIVIPLRDHRTNVITGYLAQNQDITERKLADEERKKTTEKLEAAYQQELSQRRELEEEAKARGLFIDVLAHELRTPLTPILASTSMLKDVLDTKGQGIENRLINNVQSGARTLTQRLEELLDLARYSRGTFKLCPQMTDLKKLVNESTTRFQDLIADRNQKLDFDISDDLPCSLVDPDRLEQVISNLLSNASKFSANKGEIFLKACKLNHSLLVEVTDNGIGIEPEEQIRLFQPYHRVEQDRQKFPGIGLGLAICRQIVEAHGGKIWITSQPGQGSTFHFTIPLAPLS